VVCSFFLSFVVFGLILNLQTTLPNKFIDKKTFTNFHIGNKLMNAQVKLMNTQV